MQGKDTLERLFSKKHEESFKGFFDGKTEDVMSKAGHLVGRMFSFDAGETKRTLVYSIQDRQKIIGGLKNIFRDFYVHLEIKKAQYGLDPVRALERLEPVLDTLSDVEFHQSLAQIIARVRDRHVMFMGYAPIGVNAVLPFLIERCWIENEETFVVTKIRAGYPAINLKVGAVVTHWNGMPIERYVRFNANFSDGGNEAASIARSIAFLTQRPLSQIAAPVESWVVLTFRVLDQVFEERFTWMGLDVGDLPFVPGIGRNIVGFGGDVGLMQSQLAKRVQFAPLSFEAKILADTSDAPEVPVIVGRSRNGNFEYGTVSTDQSKYGYLRIFHFAANDVDDIVLDVIDAIKQLPRNGLILDIRGNTGGYIAAGERILQLFTPRNIVPGRFQFRVTDGTRRLVFATKEFERWQDSFRQVALTGELYTQGFPIEGTDQDANEKGQQYFGPVVIVTDALAFSTADIFTAGFIDHEIGRVICIDKNMAAAGGNNWGADVAHLLAPDFKVNASFRNELQTGTISNALRQAFNQNGVSIAADATVSSASDRFGEAWILTDGLIRHKIRFIDWLDQDLLVYLPNSRFGLNDFPVGVTVGFTVRRCIRSGKNEGRLLEDLGIEPDVIYKPSLKDVLGKNEDLLLRAGMELSTMPAYDLRVELTDSGTDNYSARCVIKNVDLLEVFAPDERHLHSSTSNGTNELKLELHKLPRYVFKGYKDGKLVVKTIIHSGS